MCGLAGFVSLRHAPAAREAALGRMLTLPNHRAPDTSAFIANGPVTLGMRPLAGPDSARTRQPQVSPDARHHLILEGAIYNFRELRSDYTRRGWVFRTDSDAEVLLAALVHDGRECLTRLRGPFAFAFWDTREKALLLARDAFGGRPLFYHADPAGPLLFASVTRALLASRLVPSGLDPAAAADFLRRLAIPAPHTLHTEVRALRAGEVLVWRPNRLEVSAWWRPARALAEARVRPDLPPPAPTAAALRAELRARLDDAVQTHLSAATSTGILLSGDPASAVIAALMTRHIGPGVRAFSVGFEGEDCAAENSSATAVATHLGLSHETQTIPDASLPAEFERLLAGLDQASGASLALHAAAGLARADGITAVLTGHGGPELLGATPGFQELPRLSRALPVWRRLPAPLRRAALAVLGGAGESSRARAAALRAGDTPAAFALAPRDGFSEPELARLLAPALSTSPTSSHPAERELEAAWLGALAARGQGSPPPLAWLAGLAETRGRLADAGLHEAASLGLRHAVELRTPFVDAPLIEWAWAQDPALLHPRGAPALTHLAAACADLLPPALLTQRPSARTAPQARWLRGPLRPFVEETLNSASVGRSGLFDPFVPSRLWRAFRDGSDDRAWPRIWALTVLVRIANRG